MITIDGIQIPESKILEKGYIKDTSINPHEPWFPKSDEWYWFLDEIGNIKEKQGGWKNNVDEHYLAIGNVFKTAQEATDYKNRLYATQRVLLKLRELEGDWKADWNDRNQSKYTICIEHDINSLRVACWITDRHSPLSWYSTQEAWEFVIENMEADVLLMFGE